jgi:tRNA N6-adenosine threonylcarbamoyltransferase
MSDRVLGIETSCDETAAAVVERVRRAAGNGAGGHVGAAGGGAGGHVGAAGGGAGGRMFVRSSVVSSQIDRHARFGGVVPEIASRAHVELLTPVVAQALVEAGLSDDEVDAVAATVGPGLIGSLLVGVSAAKALALVWDVPFVGVNHLEGHLYAAFLEEPDLELPVVVLLVSGGHTMLVHMQDHGRYRLLGSTIDDAAGEAFDKVARYLGLGYPGGPVVDKLASEGDPTAVRFPRAMLDRGYDFSFSGLKTAVVNYVRKHPDTRTEDVAASFQEAVVDVLVSKALRAAQDVGAKGVCIGGGVAANSGLRRRVTEACEGAGLRPFVPSRAMCTDNAAMIAAAGWWRWQQDGPTPLDVGAVPNLALTKST